MSINWAVLYAKGRVKDIGIAWSEEELVARFTLGIPAEYVRQGILTQEDYDEARATPGDAPVTRAALEAQAKALGIEFAPEAPDAVLEKAVKDAEKAAAKAVKDAEKAAAKAVKDAEKAKKAK